MTALEDAQVRVAKAEELKEAYLMARLAEVQ